jgi:hypothetical protein
MRAMNARIAVAVATCLLVLSLAAEASARRTATRAESAAMWRVVDAAAGPSGSCVRKHPRGRISTVASKRWRYGVVTISDCANGSFVLQRAKSGGRWRIRVAGSDIGNPERCDGDARKVPLRVLRDLFANQALCA